MEQTNKTISIAESDAAILKDVLDAKLVDLRREISHTDSPRFRGTLYEVDGALQRVIEQLSAIVRVAEKT